MSDALTVPITIESEQTGIDSVVGIIKRELSTLSWLQNSLGRIKPQAKAGGGLPEPWLYKGDGDYYLAYPNDTLDSFSCLYAHDDELIEGHGHLGFRTLSIIVWLNFEALDVDTPTVEPFKQELIRTVRDLYCVESVNRSFDQTASGPNAIYPNFDVSGLDVRYLTYPYGGFRVETRVHYNNLGC